MYNNVPGEKVSYLNTGPFEADSIDIIMVRLNKTQPVPQNDRKAG